MARKAHPVDKLLLKESILKVEENGGLKNLNSLFESVAEEYNSKSGNPINKNHVKTRILAVWGKVEDGEIFFLDYKLKTKKGRRGRKPSKTSSRQEMYSRSPRNDQNGPVAFLRDESSLSKGLTDFHKKFLELKASSENKELDFYTKKFAQV